MYLFVHLGAAETEWWVWWEGFRGLFPYNLHKKERRHSVFGLTWVSLELPNLKHVESVSLISPSELFWITEKQFEMCGWFRILISAALVSISIPFFSVSFLGTSREEMNGGMEVGRLLSNWMWVWNSLIAAGWWTVFVLVELEAADRQQTLCEDASFSIRITETYNCQSKSFLKLLFNV